MFEEEQRNIPQGFRENFEKICLMLLYVIIHITQILKNQNEVFCKFLEEKFQMLIL